MKRINLFFILVIFTFCISCSKKEEKVSIIKEKSLELQVLEAYKEGMKSLEDGDVLYAAKKFNQAEILFPQSEWAPKSSLMASYSYYVQDYYADSISELERVRNASSRVSTRGSPPKLKEVLKMIGQPVCLKNSLMSL